MGAGKGGVEKKFEVIDVDDDSEDDEPKKKEQKQNNGNNAGQITPRHAGSTTDAPPHEPQWKRPYLPYSWPPRSFDL